jgi:hypothetical protein
MLVYGTGTRGTAFWVNCIFADDISLKRIGFEGPGRNESEGG